MKRFLIFSLLTLFTILLGCKQNPQNTNLPTEEKAPPSELMTFSSNAGQNFYVTGANLNGIKAVGIPHKDSSAAVVDEFLPDYDFFWEQYFQANPAILPDSLILAAEVSPLEFGKGRDPKIVVGRVVRVTAPGFFIDKNLFDKGVRRVVITDNREHSMALVQIMRQGDALFSQRGGILNTQGFDEAGFPKVVVSQYPNLKPEDIAWLKSEWYPKIWVQDSIFDANLYKIIQKRPTIVGVMGGAHAYRLHKNHGVKIGIVGTLENIAFTVMREETIRFYMEKVR